MNAIAEGLDVTPERAEKALVAALDSKPNPIKAHWPRVVESRPSVGDVESR